MAGPRRKRTVRNPGAKVSRRTADRHFKKVSIPNPDMKKLWDVHASLKDNYARLGLAGNANTAVDVLLPKDSRPVTSHTVPPSRPVAPNAAADAPPKPTLIHEIEALGPPEVPTPRHQSDGEQQFLAKLIAKHGTDYAAMARDIKLNRYQQTAAELRRRIARLNAGEGAAAKPKA